MPMTSFQVVNNISESKPSIWFSNATQQSLKLGNENLSLQLFMNFKIFALKRTSKYIKITTCELAREPEPELKRDCFPLIYRGVYLFISLYISK